MGRFRCSGMPEVLKLAMVSMQCGDVESGLNKNKAGFMFYT